MDVVLVLGSRIICLPWICPFPVETLLIVMTLLYFGNSHPHSLCLSSPYTLSTRKIPKRLTNQFSERAPPGDSN